MIEENDDDTANYFAEHLEAIARRKRLSRPKFRVSRGSKRGDNFLGLVYRAEIVGERNDELRTVHSILKCPPIDPNHRRYVDSRCFFLREIYFYEEVLPVFEDFLRESQLALGHVPTFYGASKENEKELLILEDMTRKGYAMKSSKELDYAHASLAFRCLAQFHACSFGLRTKRPEVFEKLKMNEDSVFTAEKMETMQSSGHSDGLCAVVAKALAGEDEHYRRRFDDFRKDFANASVQAVSGEAAEPYAVINHGDLWTNNLLFKYDKDTSTPIDVCFVDFQLSRYSSPVLDLLYPLFTCCPTATRREHYDQLLNDYYASLTDHLRLLDCDPSVVFPRDVFLEHTKRFGKFAAVNATLIFHVFIDDKVKDIVDIMDVENLLRRVETDGVYREKIVGTFKDLIDRDFI